MSQQKRTTFEVRGGKTGPDHPEYPENIAYWDTLSTIAAEVKKVNNDPRSLKAIMLEIARDNNLPGPRKGVDCNMNNITDVRINAGQKLVLRTDQPINPELIYNCPPEKKKPIVPAEMIEEIVQEKVEVPVAPKSQFMPTARHTAEEGMAVDSLLGFFGVPPRDAAKEFGVRKDNLARNFEPGHAEGTRVKTGGTQFEPRKGSETLDLRRAEKELEFKPERHIDFTVDEQGRMVAVQPTKGTKTKIETPLRVVDSGIGSVKDWSALIGLGRRLDPEFHNIFREGRTARNVIDPLLNTGEGAKAAITLVGTSRAIGKLSAEFAANPTTQTGEYLIQQHIKRATNKLAWSVDSLGAPIMDHDATRAEINRIISLVPEADRAAVQAKYAPYLPLIGTDRALAEAVSKAPDRAAWFDEGADWAKERASLDFIREGFGRPPGYKKGSGEAVRQANAEKELILRYRDAEVNSMGISTGFERELGSGLSMLEIPADAREARNLSPARVKLLEGIANDPKQLEAYVDHITSLPGGSQAVTDLLLYTSNKGNMNHRLLGFEADGKGRKESKRILTDLLGEDGKHNLYKEGRGFGAGLLRTITLGIHSAGKGRNINTGVFEENDIIKARLADPATRDVTLGAIKEVMLRAAAAEGQTPGGVATTALTLPLDRDWAENQFGTAGSPALNTLRDLVGAEGRKTMDAQVLYNLDNAGDRFVTAGVVVKTGQAAYANPEAIVATTDIEKLRAALATGSIVSDNPAAKGNSILTGVNIDAALAGARSGKPFLGTIPQLGADNAKLVATSSIDKFQVATLARLQPAEFAALVTQSLVSGDAQSAGLAQAVEALGKDKGGYAKDLKKIITTGARDLAAANGDPAAAAAALNAVRAETNALVSGEKAAAGRNAVNELASIINTMPATAASTVAGTVAAESVAAAPVAGNLSYEQLQGITALSTGTVSTDAAALKAQLAGVVGTTAVNEADVKAINVAMFKAGASADSQLAVLDGINSIIADNKAAVAGGKAAVAGAALTADQITQLTALGANPPADVNALNAQVASIVGTSTVTAENLTALTDALKAANATEASQQAIAAGVQAAVAANTSSTVAGPVAGSTESTVAGGPVAGSAVAGPNSPASLVAATLAGTHGQGNADQAQQFLAGLSDDTKAKLASVFAGTNNPTDQAKALEAFVAGLDANTQQLFGKWGISVIEIIKFVPLIFIPPTPENPLIPELPGIPGCPGCPRPTPGGFPGLPG